MFHVLIDLFFNKVLFIRLENIIDKTQSCLVLKTFTHKNKNTTMRHTPFSSYYNMIIVHQQQRLCLFRVHKSSSSPTLEKLRTYITNHKLFMLHSPMVCPTMMESTPKQQHWHHRHCPYLN